MGVVGDGEGDGDGEDRDTGGTTIVGVSGARNLVFVYIRCSGVRGDSYGPGDLTAGGVTGGDSADLSANAEDVRECRLDWNA